MKKQIIKRSLMGAPIGVLICQIIAIFISFAIHDGHYYAVVPELTDICGGESTAVLVQTIFACVYGAVWAGISVIWEIDEWSLMRQSILHFVISSSVTFPVAYITRWMSHTLVGILTYFGIFAGIYLVIWITQYYSMKKKIQKMNRKIQETSK